MRRNRADGTNLNPEDVAWVAEWLLASTVPWVPIGEESLVIADAMPEGRWWVVTIHVGAATACARLAVRDLSRLVHWCQNAPDYRSLARPPLRVRAGILAITRLLHAALSPINPLSSMGYAGRQ